MTHSHALDLELVAALLKRGDFAYCGMIGSATKRRTFEKGLGKLGVSPATIGRLTCPIGIPGIKGKEPGTIAVAVAAQLLELHARAATPRTPEAAVEA
jgi:xanthine dehydrogenase accessory factor